MRLYRHLKISESLTCLARRHIIEFKVRQSKLSEASCEHGDPGARLLNPWNDLVCKPGFDFT